ncbi:MAG TPA: zf-HC2 domain-containing protein [Candidatus Binatia bacterium]|nr:zf-HC2 domain-containing protein [Candidatus Binatia bacterium]
MNDHLGEDAELFALGVLDDGERARVEAHAAACAECSRRLGEAEAVVAELASSHPRAEKVTPLPVRRRGNGPMATAAALVVAVGVTIASLFQVQHLQARLSSDDAVLATIATSHFNHTAFAKTVRDAPTAKLLNGRHGEWLYVIVDAPASDLHVVGDRSGAPIDLGIVQVHGKTATFFVRDPGRLGRVALERGGSVIETATPSYRDE